MGISYNPNTARKLANGLNNKDGIELPFPVVYFWALNGQANNSDRATDKTKAALFFGGWACNSDELQKSADAQGLEIPADLHLFHASSRDGKAYDEHITRSLLVAPIAMRVSWYLFADGQTKRSADYFELARRHVQILAFMGVKDKDGKYQPWGPVVLSAKGHQASSLITFTKKQQQEGKWGAFDMFAKASAQLRTELAKENGLTDLPSWMFYTPVGTFGKERKQDLAGKGSNKSPITPMSTFVDGLNKGLLESLFVGEENIDIMAGLKEQAEDWLNAWKNAGKDNGESFDGSEPEEPPF
jgi:hypothetical protein